MGCVAISCARCLKGLSRGVKRQFPESGAMSLDGGGTQFHTARANPCGIPQARPGRNGAQHDEPLARAPRAFCFEPQQFIADDLMG